MFTRVPIDFQAEVKGLKRPLVSLTILVLLIAGAYLGLSLYSDLNLADRFGSLKSFDEAITFQNLSFTRPSGREMWAVTAGRATRTAAKDLFWDVAGHTVQEGPYGRQMTAASGSYVSKDGLLTCRTVSGSWNRSAGLLNWKADGVEWRSTDDIWSFKGHLELDDHRTDDTMMTLRAPEALWQGKTGVLDIQEPQGHWDRPDNPIDFRAPHALWTQSDDLWTFDRGVTITSLRYDLTGRTGSLAGGQFVHLDGGTLHWRPQS